MRLLSINITKDLKNSKDARKEFGMNSQRFEEIREKIASGFYNQEWVIRIVASKVAEVLKK